GRRSGTAHAMASRSFRRRTDSSPKAFARASASITHGRLDAFTRPRITEPATPKHARVTGSATRPRNSRTIASRPVARAGKLCESQRCTRAGLRCDDGQVGFRAPDIANEQHEAPQ